MFQKRPSVLKKGSQAVDRATKLTVWRLQRRMEASPAGGGGSVWGLPVGHGRLITLDALHTQRETARLILAQGGQYLMAVKANQPDLYAALTEWCVEPAWAEEQEQTVTTHGKGHGRLERRTLTRRVATHTLLDWLGTAQVLQRRMRQCRDART